ncbi:protein O-mannosyl-transferase family [Chryseobacterium pennipullorum]|uniref:DUF2723 domain-containing protein n=1 Tax=Chryseobacterium pennipullorum TaxID=2258963 RepID=A0A3D9B069_9FLAO|nr:DUF2723 domain-containing protein [Chryseobacterium pennipullorum]REC47013.1 hypothetical protein DRF67_12395 [Chryseobacterium pennipullorum]
MNKYLSAGFLFFIFLAVYYAGSFTRIPFADAIGFILPAEKGKFVTTATATSHFLYTNTVIFVKNLAGINAIEASRFVIITSAALTVSVIYATVRVITKLEWASLAAAFIFGFSFSFWKNAEIVEVYTYNSLWLSLFFFSMVKSFKEKNKVYIPLSALFLGVSLWVHIQNILLLPAFFLFLYYFRQEKKYAYLSFIIFALIFSAITILNISQGLSLGSPYTSERGEWLSNSFKKTWLQYLQDVVKSVVYVIYNFNVFFIAGIAGIFYLYTSDRKMFFVFFTASLFVYGFATFYAVTDNYVFFIPFNIIFALSAGYGLSQLKYPWIKKFSWLCLGIPLFYLLSLKLVSVTRQGQNFDQHKKYKGGLEYYMYPWMNNNIGILEFTIDGKTAPDPMIWMTVEAEKYIEFLKSKGFTEEQIRKL